MSKHNHKGEHKLLYLACGACGSHSLSVTIIEGAILFDCVICKTEVGAMDDIQEDSRRLLEQGCTYH